VVHAASPDPLGLPPPLAPGPGGTSYSSACAGSWWVTFPLSARRLRPLRGALRAPLGLRSAARDASIQRSYRRGPSALPCVPMSVKSFRRLGAVQAGGPGLFQAAFILGALPELVALAGATRPWVGRARTSRREPLTGPRCVVLPGPWQRWLSSVLRPVCLFWVFSSASLSVAQPCFLSCMCDCT
jgi:hypothetical protein